MGTATQAITEMIIEIALEVNPVRNSSRRDSKPSGALNPAGILLRRNPAAEQRGIISNGVNKVALVFYAMEPWQSGWFLTATMS
jgi:hypothetical protein